MQIDSEQKERLKTLLQKYKVSPDDIQKVLKNPMKNIQEWKEFIEDQINTKKHDEFTQQLRIILSRQCDNGKSMELKNPQIQFVEELQKVYQDISPQNINVRSLKSISLKESKWSDELMGQLEILIQKQVDKFYKQTQTLKEFLQQSLQTIYDLIARRQGLTSYFTIVQMISKKYNTKASDLISKMNINDFVVLLIKSIKNKNSVGKLLSQNNIPIPVLFQMKNTIEYNPDLLKHILSIKSNSFILNIGTPKMRKCGKTKLMSSLFSLSTKKNQGSHFSNVLNFYTNFSFGIKEKTILADFNGQLGLEYYSPLNQKLKSYSKKASLIILHAKENQILQEKILDNQNYKQMLSGVEKIILIIRDAEYSTEKKIKNFLPQALKEKTTIFIVENLSESQQNLQEISIKLIKKIMQNNLNKFNKKQLKFEDIQKKQYIVQQKKQEKQKYINIIKDLINKLNEKDYRRNKILQGTTIQQQLYEKQKYITSIKQNQKENQIEYYQRMSENKTLLNQLKDKLKNVKLSNFMNQVIQILQKGQFKFNQYLMESLIQWKKQNLQPLKSQYISLTNNLRDKGKGNPDQIKLKIRSVLQEIEQYEISIDTILNQIIIYSQIHQQKQQLKSLINDYYQDSYEKLIPINIIEGKTLKFGNQGLKSFFQKLSQYYQEKNKKVYVISVIGAQSSAKSTLLNMLFRCSFQTSAGRCTKGVYFNICQLQDMVIVVFDTQGLLSVSARDAAFDNQIASFILKVSNLIIINNKGELTANLKELLKVCMYVLSCLHHDDKKQQYTPQRLIFTLRDQNKPTGNFQEEMLAQIQNELQTVKNDESIDYTNFFKIQTQDIFSLPNAFQQKNGISGQIGSYSTYYSVFGKCMLALRNRIIKLLKGSIPQKNLQSFYNQASTSWQTIQKCGKDIFNYKTFNEIIVKGKLLQILDKTSKKHKKSIQQKYNNFMQIIKGLTFKQLSEQTYQIELEKIGSTSRQQFRQDFLNQACKICCNLNWISDMYVKIYDSCNSFSLCYNQQMNKMKKKKISQQKLDQFQNDLNNMVQNLLNDRSDDQAIKKKFQQKKNQLQKQYTNMIYSFKKQRNQFEIKLLQFFDFKLEQIQKLKLKISSSQLCIQSYINLKINIQNTKNDDKKWLQKLFKFNFAKTFTLTEKDCRQLYQLMNQRFCNFQYKLSKKITNSKILNFAQIEINFNDWINLMQSQIEKIEKQLEKIKKSWFVLNLIIKQKQVRIVFFGLIFQVLLNKVFQNNLNNLIQQYKNVIKLIQLKHDQVQKALECRGQIGQTLKIWIQKLIDKTSSRMNEMCLEKVEKILFGIRNNLNPQTILAKGIKRSFLKEDGKTKWRQCFKIIKNINKYLFEIMCQQNEIVTRKQIIANEINSIKYVISGQISQQIQQLKNLNFGNSIAVYKFIKKNNFIFVENEKFTKQKILKQFLNQLNNRQNDIISLINGKLDQEGLKLQVEKYIDNQLRDKVIGCQHTCPKCGMKCKKQKNHSDHHQVMKNCHTMTAFGRWIINNQNTPSFSMCFTKKNLSLACQLGQQNFANGKQFIRQKYPDWNSHFPELDQQVLMQVDTQSINYVKIWVNIQDMILKYVYKHMVKDQNCQYYQFKRQDSLTDKDLDQQYQNYKGQKTSMRKQYKLLT